MAPLRALLVFLGSVLALALVLPAACQVTGPTYPFIGQGDWPGTLGRARVVANVHLERILAVYQEEQSWRAVHRFHLTWQDPRAQAAVQDATTAWRNASGGRTASVGCNLPCDASLTFRAGCCDTLWLPHIDLPNLLSFDTQEHPPRWRIWVEQERLPDGSTNDTVHWTVRVDATWFSPFDFRAWPLEHQHLLLEMQPAIPVADTMVLIMGSTDALSNTPHTKGVDLAGWRITKVTPRLFDTSACYALTNATSWAFDTDTGTAVPVSITPSSFPTLSSDTTVVTTLPESSCNSIHNVEAIAQYGPNVLLIDIQVSRDQAYYVIIFIVPLVIIDMLVFVVYAMERHNLEARMGVVVTLVLALTALQFTYNFPPASYLNVVQQLTLASYVLFALVSIGCIVTSTLCRIHERNRRYAANLAAAGLADDGSFKEFGSSAALPEPAKDVQAPDVTSDQGFSGLMFGASTGASGWKSGRPAKAESQHTLRSGHSTVTSTAAASPAPAQAAVSPPTAEVAADKAAAPELPEEPGRSGRQPVAEGTTYNGMLGINLFATQKPDGGDVETAAEPPPLSAADIKRQNRLLQRGGKSLANLFSRMHTTTRKVGSRINADEAYAQLVARRVDQVLSLVLVFSYIIVVTTLLAVSSSVGDHKLMLAGSVAPGNM